MNYPPKLANTILVLLLVGVGCVLYNFNHVSAYMHQDAVSELDDQQEAPTTESPSVFVNQVDPSGDPATPSSSPTPIAAPDTINSAAEKRTISTATNFGMPGPSSAGNQQPQSGSDQLAPPANDPQMLQANKDQSAAQSDNNQAENNNNSANSSESGDSASTDNNNQQQQQQQPDAPVASSARGLSMFSSGSTQSSGGASDAPQQRLSQPPAVRAEDLPTIYEENKKVSPPQQGQPPQQVVSLQQSANPQQPGQPPVSPTETGLAVPPGTQATLGANSTSTARTFDSWTTCVGQQSNKHGTCKNEMECSKHKGRADGSCMGGFGVCCVMALSCNQKSIENNTFFANPDFPEPSWEARQCEVELVKKHKNILQFMIEFDEFELAPPNHEGECITDVFQIKLSSNRPSPYSLLRICGQNTGQHLYLDVSQIDEPIVLSVATSGGGYPRRWSIRIVQMDEKNFLLAPPGCLQYYTDTVGHFRSFNLGRNLRNLYYAICFRIDNGYSGIRFTENFFGMNGPQCRTRKIAPKIGHNATYEAHPHHLVIPPPGYAVPPPKPKPHHGAYPPPPPPTSPPVYGTQPYQQQPPVVYPQQTQPYQQVPVQRYKRLAYSEPQARLVTRTIPEHGAPMDGKGLVHPHDHHGHHPTPMHHPGHELPPPPPPHEKMFEQGDKKGHYESKYEEKKGGYGSYPQPYGGHEQYGYGGQHQMGGYGPKGYEHQGGYGQKGYEHQGGYGQKGYEHQGGYGQKGFEHQGYGHEGHQGYGKQQLGGYGQPQHYQQKGSNYGYPEHGAYEQGYHHKEIDRFGKKYEHLEYKHEKNHHHMHEKEEKNNGWWSSMWGRKEEKKLQEKFSVHHEAMFPMIHIPDMPHCEPRFCGQNDVITFPPSGDSISEMCGNRFNRGRGPKIISGSPLVVYVSNRGASRGAGFDMNYEQVFFIPKPYK